MTRSRDVRFVPTNRNLRRNTKQKRGDIIKRREISVVLKYFPNMERICEFGSESMHNNLFCEYKVQNGSVL